MPARSGKPGEAVRVLVVDDHELFAKTLAMFLSRDERIEVVGMASTGQQAIDLAVERLADVVVMDLFMRGMDGLESTERLRTISPHTRVIILSGLDGDDLAEQARAVGAEGHFQKGAVHDGLVDAVLAAAQPPS